VNIERKQEKKER